MECGRIEYGMLRHEGFIEQRTDMALQMLMIDRRNEFRELAQTILGSGSQKMSMEDMEYFVLNFCMDVNKAFKCWSGENELPLNSALQTLTIVRQLSRGKKTMNELAHLLNISYNIAEEFKVVYKRIE